MKSSIASISLIFSRFRDNPFLDLRGFQSIVIIGVVPASNQVEVSDDLRSKGVEQFHLLIEISAVEVLHPPDRFSGLSIRFFTPVDDDFPHVMDGTDDIVGTKALPQRFDVILVAGVALGFECHEKCESTLCVAPADRVLPWK